MHLRWSSYSLTRTKVLAEFAVKPSQRQVSCGCNGDGPL